METKSAKKKKKQHKKAKQHKGLEGGLQYNNK